MAASSDLVLARFAARYGLELDRLRGKPIPTSNSQRQRSDPYSVRLPRFVDHESFDGAIQAVRIRQLYRFSNSLVQLAHALDAARNLGAAEVQLPHAWYLRRGYTPLASGLALVNGSRHHRPDATTLLGDYFYGYSLAPVCPDRPSRRELLRQLRPALILSIQDPPLPDDHIVLHVRSGDLFGNDPHPAYFQPPLAFYLRALQGQPWGHVHLVFEDYGNPVVQALAAWCKGQELPLTLHSWGLERDLSLLLKAHTLVVGRGTFIPGVVALSENARQVHSFGPFDLGDVWGLGHLSNLIYSDSTNRYVRLMRPWRHTRKQRELMLSFPLDQIELRSSRI